MIIVHSIPIDFLWRTSNAVYFLPVTGVKCMHNGKTKRFIDFYKSFFHSYLGNYISLIFLQKSYITLGSKMLTWNICYLTRCFNNAFTAIMLVLLHNCHVVSSSYPLISSCHFFLMCIFTYLQYWNFIFQLRK